MNLLAGQTSTVIPKHTEKRKWKKKKKRDNFIQLYSVKNLQISHFKHSIWTDLQIYILNLWEDCLHKKTSNNFYRSFQLYSFFYERTFTACI